MTDDEIDALIEDVAENPKRVAGDGQSVEEHSIPDLLKLKDHNAANAAPRRAGVRFSKLVPPPGGGGR